MKLIVSSLFAVIVMGAFSHLTQAAHEPAAYHGKPEMEVLGGVRARPFVRTTIQTPKAHRSAWTGFLAEFGKNWRIMWDADTRVPLRIFGGGIPVPGAVADPKVAERHTRKVLTNHIDLFAPGNTAVQFVLVSNVVHRGIRTVGFVQTYEEVPVLGGQVSFRYKADRLTVIGSEAMPDITIRLPKEILSGAALKNIANSWLLADSAKNVAFDSNAIEGPFVLPIIQSNKKVQYHYVMSVTADTVAPLGRWQVFLAADTGQRIARRQTLRFAEGTVLYSAPKRQPLDERQQYPALNTSVVVDGNSQDSSDKGIVNWTGQADTTIEVQLTGPLINVTTRTGTQATKTLPLSADGTIVWDESNNKLADAQLTSFIHARIAKDRVRTFNPDLDWLDTQLPVFVNINDSCNAFSDGNSINFFVDSGQCANTGRLADVVYHEFGHSMHSNSIIEGVGSFDGAFSEGLSDYLSATITNDPQMGVGFFKNDAPLRHIDPLDREHVWPEDVAEIHTTGLIFSGAMWDLRKLLIAQHGEVDGVILADRLFYAAVQRASSIPTTYVEILLEDDDDGDLSNGTPNLCDINSSFGIHGLRSQEVDSGNLSVESPDADQYQVTMNIRDFSPQCPGDGILEATLHWSLRGDSEIAGEVAMVKASEGFVAAIPSAKDGEVIRYHVVVQFEDGGKKNFPNNRADPSYELYVGDVVELYCTDFSSDPFAEGWTHGLSRGTNSEGADDWTWGKPAGRGGDPSAGFSGDEVVGNDLGGDMLNGLYQKEKTNFLLSPKIPVGEYSDVRLQYRRWLNVEDGFFDQGTIYSNDDVVWSNLNTDSGDNSNTHHQDSEWRFHDVALTGTEVDNSVQIKFEISSDGGLEMGGWNIDDFCVVANQRALCGDNETYGNEQCDNGGQNSDTEPDACRSSCLLASCGDGVVDSDEICDDGNDIDGDGCETDCLSVGNTGDCGCTVGGAHQHWADGKLALLLLGILGILLLRRQRQLPK